MRRLLLPLTCLLLLSTAGPAVALDVTVRRTAYGVPHVEARDWKGLGHGFAYAFAQDNLCTIADSYVTVAGERSRYFGPDESWSFYGNGSTVKNLNSDFFYGRINADRTVEALVAKKAPLGPRPEVRKLVAGYVSGYNAYLRKTGVDKLPDPRCRGADWVRPITEIDVYRRFYQLASLASQGVAIDGIGGAQPPTPSLIPTPLTPTQQGSMLSELGKRLPLGEAGSNAYGLGSEMTKNKLGMVLGNPHFPWQGAERLYQAQLTIPGKLNVSGAALYGVPLVLIGNTRGLAWSHTVATAFRFTPFELKLVPGDPTSYLYDGEVRRMKATKVTVKAKTAGGGLEDRTRTLYATTQGPILTEILGLPLFPWTPTTAYAMGDANAGNFRYLNHFLETNMAQTVRQFDAIQRRNQGIPWVNSIAADRRGEAYYSMDGAIPNVPDSKVEACPTVLGQASFSLLGLPTLDGSRSACEWDDDPKAVAPGIFDSDSIPSMFRRDFTHNGNDSHWLTNPKQPLEGFARIIGDERTERSLRTRVGLKMLERGPLSLRGLQKLAFSNRQYAGELWRDALVPICRSESGIPALACDALAGWDVKDDLASRGALLFRRFAERSLGSGLPAGAAANPPFSVPFDVNDPVNTPRGLRDDSQTRQNLRDAVADLGGAGIPLDAPLRDFQYEVKNGKRIPIHGGPGGLGVFNAINVKWDPKAGYPDVAHGSSFVMATAFKRRGCPVASRTLVTYGQSENPRSRYFADQTRLFSAKKWNAPPFCRAAVLKATKSTLRLRHR